MINQGTFEWYYDRFGMITSSDRIDTIISGNPHQLNALIDTLRWEKSIKEDVAHVKREYERELAASYHVEALAWGRKMETEALDQYELVYTRAVQRCGFRLHPLWPEFVGDSADFIEDDTFVGEVKCYKDPEKHLRALRYGMDPTHHNQVQGHIECWDAPRAKFVSYDPRAKPADKQLYVQVIERDVQWQLRFRTRMQEFVTHYRNRTRFEFTTSSARDGIPSMF